MKAPLNLICRVLPSADDDQRFLMVGLGFLSKKLFAAKGRPFPELRRFFPEPPRLFLFFLKMMLTSFIFPPHRSL